MKIMVSVITAPRYTDAFYLPETLRHLSSQLDSDCLPLVTADAYSPEVPAMWRLQSHPGPERRGSRLQMRAVFEAFIESGAERLLYCEDDIIPCRNLVEYARRLEIPDAWPLVSFFDPRMWQEIGGKRIEKVVALPSRFFLFTQCLVIERKIVKGLLDFDFTAQPYRIRGPNGSDSMLGGFMGRLGFTAYGAQIPNLVTHVGEDSIVMRGKTYVTGERFGCVESPGADFDCMSLTRETTDTNLPRRH